MHKLFLLLISSATILFAQDRQILINTIPKSGSVFLKDTIQRNLKPFGFEFCRISDERFHDSAINRKTLLRNIRRPFFNQSHLDPSPRNLVLLKKYLPKFVLHLRDPRQVVISWYHHVEKHQKNHYYLWSDDIQPPDEYFTWNDAEKLNWQIENFLPVLVKWIEDWTAVIDSGKFQILVTTFEEMIEEQSAFMQKILCFFGYEIDKPEFAPFEPGKLHHRKGRKDEWKEVFSPAQKQRISQLIPPELLARFEWDLNYY